MSFKGPTALLTRRELLAATALLAGGLASARADESCVDIGPMPVTPARGRVALGDISERVAWGVAIESPAVFDTKLIEALAAESPKFLAIASGLKFDYLYPHRPEAGAGANWSECDVVLALAARLGVPVRGDCLAWNDWQPEWLKSIASERPDGWQLLLRGYFARHFRDVFAHFSPTDPMLRWCGVVNEPFNPWFRTNGGAAWRTGAWIDAFGFAADGVPAYIHEAFALGAKHAAAGTALFLNETNCDNDKFGPLVRPALLALVDKLQRAGRRVDAIGLECHLVPQWMNDPRKPDFSAFVAFLRDLARRGVRILLTELDVNDCSMRDADDRDRLVADTMYEFVAASTAVPAVEMVTNWDFSDKYSWLRSAAVYPSLQRWSDCVAAPPCPRPDIYDEAMQPKAARAGLARALGER